MVYLKEMFNGYRIQINWILEGVLIINQSNDFNKNHHRYYKICNKVVKN